MQGPVFFYDGRRNGGAVLVVIVVIGLVTAFVSLYGWVRDECKRALIGWEEHIMEVRQDENGHIYISENERAR
jgi:hypothetical protein